MSIPFGNIKPSTERFDPVKEKNQRYLGLEHLEKDTGRIITTSDSKTTVSSKTVFHKGDLLYGKLRPYLNKVVIPDFDGVCSSDILVFPKNPFITNILLKFCLLKPDFVSFANNTITGVQHPRTSHKKLSGYPIPIPPFPEQHRIVKKIESIFAQIDAAKERLERLARQTSSGPDSISQLKSSILKQAFEGKLVPQDPNDEPAEALLKRLHDKTLQFKKEGLPEGWTSVIFKHLIKKIPLTGKKIKHQEYQKKGTIPIIDQGQGFIGGYTENVERIVSCNLPVIVFGDHTKSIKFVDHKFAAGADGVKVLEPNPILNPKLLYYFIQSIQLPDRGYARHYQFLEKTIIHMPPLAEQHRIVQKIESIFARIDATDKLVKDSLIRLDLLKKSVLKKAFEGKLVPQDPNDEPAEMLLQRIKQEQN